MLVGAHAVPLAGVKRCSRCRVTTIDQDTGAAPADPPTAEPLATLRRLRANAKGEVFMGVNLVHDWAACSNLPAPFRTLRVGDVVRPTEVGAIVPP